MNSIDDERPFEAPWSVRDTWIGVASLFFLIVLLMLTTFLLPDLDIGLFLIFGELVFLIPVWYLGIWKYRASWDDLGLRSFKVGSLAVGCGLMIVSWLFNLGYGLFLGLYNLQVQPDFSLLFDGTISPGLIFFGGAFIAPIVEEVIFRGFIFAGLKERFGWVKSALISAVLFSLIHFQLAAILPIFILGMIFAYLYHLSGSIWPAVIMHVSTNALGLGTVYFVSKFELLDLTMLLR
ncbi:MAG: CPBP family intramembrane metalloprotease [Anaerolineales bacterium]|nr:CPBP family intramembrane metalloprotease [Anaerolineales bacterium]